MHPTWPTNPSKNLPGPFGAVPGPFRNTPEPRKCKKLVLQPQQQTSYHLQGVVSASFWDPAGSPKSTKNGPRPKKCVRRWRRKRFLSFFRAVDVRSRSQDRFLEGPTLQNRVPTTSRSTILTKSPFSKNEKVPSGDPFWDQKLLKIDVGGPKIAKIGGKNRFFDCPFFDRFFDYRKNRQKSEKRRLYS